MPKKKLPLAPKFDCSRCPGFCCSYGHVPVSDADLRRLARHFDLSEAQAEKRFTKFFGDERGMRHKKDHVYATTCMFFDQRERKCTIYAARPYVCRSYPCGDRCGYYEFLVFERELVGDEAWIPGQ